MAVGRVAWTATDVAINQDLKALIAGPQIYPRFLFHVLTSGHPWLASRGSGTTVEGIRLETLRSFPILLPPHTEQLGIAAILDAIDEAIERGEAVLAATETLQQTLLRELLTRGMPGWHSQWKQVPELGMVPACWEVTTLGHVTHIQTGRAVNKSRNGPRELPYLSVANVKDGHLNLAVIKTMKVSEDEVDRYRLQIGDLLLTEGGDADKLGRGTIWRGEIADCLHQNHIFAVRARRDRVTPEFLAAFSASTAARRYFLGAAKQTTNLASLNSTQLRKLPISLPAMDEQHVVVEALEAALRTLAAQQATLLKTRVLKTALADALLTGHLRMGLADVRD